MARLWRMTTEAPEGKYLVKRRDGTVPEWPWFVLGARDPAAPAALRAYADAAETSGFDPQYVRDIRYMADDWEAFRERQGAGDPDAPKHRKDDPMIVAQMTRGRMLD